MAQHKFELVRADEYRDTRLSETLPQAVLFLRDGVAVGYFEDFPRDAIEFEGHQLFAFGLEERPRGLVALVPLAEHELQDVGNFTLPEALPEMS